MSISKKLAIIIGLTFFLQINFVSAADKPYYKEGEILVKFKENLASTIRLEKKYNIKNIKSINKNRVVLFKSENNSTATLLELFKNDSLVEYAQPNYLYHITAQTTPWGIGTDGVQADTAQTVNGVTGNGVVVAVIDTGVDYDHEDLAANMWNAPAGICEVSEGVVQACPNHGWDTVDNDNDPTDEYGHGTHVSGTIAAANNGLGVIGVAPEANIMAVRVLDATGYGTSAQIINGINFARLNNADVINMSLGGYQYDQGEKDAVDEAWNAGVVVVTSAGNDTETLLSYPGGFENTITVAAIQENTSDTNPVEDMNTRLAYFSNYGFVDVAAPGVNITSTTYDGSYQSGWNGTSMACPHVAGTAALILELHPTFTPDQVKRIIESTATDLGKTGRDQYFGSGLVNANAATSALTNKMILSANFREDNADPTNPPTSYTPVMPADGTSTVPIRAILLNSSGTLISGATVTFSTNKGTLSTNSAITDANGIAEITLMSTNIAGTATITAEATGYNAQTVEVDMANVLLVSDSGEWWLGNNFSWFYETALQNLNQKFMRWDTFRDGYDEYPTADYLNKFSLVIWYNADYGISDEAQNILATYMDNGGSLILSGPDLLYYTQHTDLSGVINSDIIFSSYLKSTYGDDFSSSISPVTGTDILDGLSLTLANPPYPGYYVGLYPDYITLNTGATAIANYAGGEIAGALINSSYQAVYLPFGIESIDNQTGREELFQKLLEYFDIYAITGITVSDITTNSATITWDPYTEGAVYDYTFSYGIDALASNLDSLNTDNNYYNLTNLDPGTIYYVKVTANLVDGSSVDYAISSFTSSLAAPTDLAVSAQTASTITLGWTAPDGTPDSYNISYGTDTSAANIGLVNAIANYYQIAALQSNKAYYFKVAAVKNSIAYEYGDIEKIRTKPAKVKKIKLLIIDSSTVKVSWHKVRGKHIRYTIKLMDQHYRKIKIIKTKNLKKTISSLTPEKNYKIKIRAVHKPSGLQGKWSKIKGFTTGL